MVTLKHYALIYILQHTCYNIPEHKVVLSWGANKSNTGSLFIAY